MWIAILIAVALYFFFIRGSGSAAASGKPGTIPTIRGSGDFDVEVVGESHYQRHLRAICGRPTEDGVDMEIYAGLILEDNNKHDDKAVAVHIENGCVGHLSKADARAFRDAIGKTTFANCKAFQVKALIRGGWDRGNGDTGMYGVRLDMSGWND